MTEDDVHDGHFIPKGSTVLANIWYADMLYSRVARKLIKFLIAKGITCTTPKCILSPTSLTLTDLSLHLESLLSVILMVSLLDH